MSLTNLAILVISVCLAMSVHELAHGLVSYWLGDPTAKLDGRLSLNPFKHIDWAGLFCLVVFGFGWAKPVNIDSRYYRDQKTGIIWTSFAGPVANFLLSFLCVFIWFFIIRFGAGFAVTGIGQFAMACLQRTAMLSIGFGIFNLLPIPPLDGSKILFSFLPEDKYYRFVEGSPILSIVFILLLLSGFLSSPLGQLQFAVIDFFQNICLSIFGL